MAGRMPASWRAHCPPEREGRISSERDSEAASVATRLLLYTYHRATGWLGGVGGKWRGSPSTGGPAKRVPVMGRMCI